MGARRDLVELVVGQAAAGGGCVAHLDDGRVAFVRYAVPGERVRARITSVSKAFVRADAVEIIEASPARVPAPCRFAGPGRCGGCDWQHVSLATQRKLKEGLIEEQLSRLAGLDRPVEVEPVPGDVDGLSWRSRVRYSVSPGGHLGLRKHRSHQIQRIDRCLIASAAVRALRPERLKWAGAASVEVLSAGEAGPAVVSLASRRHQEVEVPQFEGGLLLDDRVIEEPVALKTEVLGHRFQVSAGVFWQVHVGAPAVLARVVRDFALPCDGLRIADLYAGVGLFSVLLAGAVGPTGRLLAVERDARACADLAVNSAGLGNVEVVQATVSAELVDGGLNEPQLVVLDPPRQGAGATVMAGLARLPEVRRIVYVACDPASFARDLRVMLDRGWTVESLRGFDLFPMTEHVEIVACLDRPGSRLRPQLSQPPPALG